MYKQLFIALFTTFSFLASGQTDIDQILKDGYYLNQKGVRKKVTYRRKNRLLAANHILLLKDGVLLVRLQTRENAIKALRQHGNNKSADKIEVAQEELNRDIIAAFQKNFDFCPVYFFLSNDSESILNKEFSQVDFLDSNLKPIVVPKFGGKDIYIAEFGTISQESSDTAKIRNLYGHNSPNAQKQSYSAITHALYALVIKNNGFIQLSRPFPYYIMTPDFTQSKEKPDLSVMTMNNALHKYYKMISRKIKTTWKKI